MSRDTMLDIAVKALTAAGFFFVLQAYILGSTLEIGLQWAAVGGLGAAYLAWSQATRR